MKYIYTLACGLALFALTFMPAQAEAPMAVPAPTPKVWDKQAIFEAIETYSKKYGVSAHVMAVVVSCETAGTFNPNIQSQARYKRNNPRWGVLAGDQEKSFGLAQIHLPDNKDVTLSEATDPEFALEFLARNLAAGRGGMWTCYRIHFA